METWIYLVLASGGGITLFFIAGKLDRVLADKLSFWGYFDLLTPPAEEIVFRLPLLILFESLTPGAWAGILLGGVLFGLVHMWSIHITITASPRIPFINVSSDVSGKNDVLLYFVALIFSVLVGWITVLTQTLLWAVLIHVVWNSTLAFVEAWQKRQHERQNTSPL